MWYCVHMTLPVSSERPGRNHPDAPRLAGELRTVLGQLVRRLREQAPPSDLSWPQINVLGRLEREGPSTVTELARTERMRPQSMGATVATLEEAGLVAGHPHPTDGRQTVLTLTERGLETVRQNRSAREDWLCRAIEHNLDDREQVALGKLVALLGRLVDLD